MSRPPVQWRLVALSALAWSAGLNMGMDEWAPCLVFAACWLVMLVLWSQELSENSRGRDRERTQDR